MKKLIVLSLLFSASFTCFSQELVKIKECVIEGGVLKNIEVDYNPSNGERSILVNGVRKNFYNLYPKQGRDYAEGQPWFINNSTVNFNGKPYVKYGLPRVLGTVEIEKTGLYNGIGVYTEAGLSGPAEVIYIPVRQGCEFQPYQLNCGSVQIEKINSSASLMQFKATTTGMAGKVSYVWESPHVKIVKGQGTANIIVDIKTKQDGEDFDLSVTATDAKKCPVTSNTGFIVEKPGAKATAKSQWGETEKKAFMEQCVKSSQLGDVNGKLYCSCMLEKIIKLHPNPLTVDKELKQEWVEANARLCLPKQ